MSVYTDTQLFLVFLSSMHPMSVYIYTDEPGCGTNIFACKCNNSLVGLDTLLKNPNQCNALTKNGVLLGRCGRVALPNANN